MGFSDLLSKLFGNKAQRDQREIQPIVNKIKDVYPSIQKLSNDELRERTRSVREKISLYVADEMSKIEELRAGIDAMDVEKRDGLRANR